MTGNPRVGWVPASADPKVASVRIRCLNPIKELQRRGHDVTVAKRKLGYDVLVLSKRYDEATLQWALDERARRGTRLILDLCDNHFHIPHANAKLEEYAARLRALVAQADAVAVSTSTLGDVVRAETGVEPAAIIDDAIEESFEGFSADVVSRLSARWQLRRLQHWLAQQRAHRATPVVWFGAAHGPYGSAGMLDLERIRTLLEGLDREHALSLTVISNSPDLFEQSITGWKVAVHYVGWDAATFHKALRAHSIAVIPITPTPYTICKSNNRVATALWNGLAVVADAIPSYLPFHEATVLDDWEQGLRRYLLDAKLRADHIAAGRRLVRERCMIGRIADQWMQLFETVASMSPTRPAQRVAE